MTIEEKELLKRYLTHLNILGKEGTHAHIEALVPGSALRPRAKRPTQRDGSLRAPLQGHPGRRPGLQPTGGHQIRSTNFVSFYPPRNKGTNLPLGNNKESATEGQATCQVKDVK